MFMRVAVGVTHFLWTGPIRRPIKRIIAPRIGIRTSIAMGPLRGSYFPAGHLQLLGAYEPSLQQLFVSRLRPGDTFFDVGANHGFFTLLASHLVGESGHVFAFEPMPANLDLLSRVVDRNSLTNVTIVSAAVAAARGSAMLAIDERGDGSTPSIVRDAIGTSIEVPAVPLNEYSDLSVDLIKVDVEGAEALVVEGASEILARRTATWAVELHGPREDESTAAKFAAAGYIRRDLGRTQASRYPRLAVWSC